MLYKSCPWMKSLISLDAKHGAERNRRCTPMHADFRRIHPRESACIGGFIPLFPRSNGFDRRGGIDDNSKRKAHALQTSGSSGRLAQLGERRVRNAEAGG